MKRIRTRNTAGSGGSGGTIIISGGRDATWASGINTQSDLNLDLTLSSQASSSSELSAGLVLDSQNNTQTEHTVTLDAYWPREVDTQTGWDAFITGVVDFADSYVDEDASSTNFGSVDPLIVRPAVIAVQGGAHLVFKYDLTGWEGMSIDEVRLIVNSPAGLGESINVIGELRRVPTSPWEEGTVTWDNHESNQGTLICQDPLTLTNGLVTETEFTFAWTAGDEEVGQSLGDIPGNWLYIKIIPTSDVQVSTVLIHSKENGSFDPRLEFDLTGIT